MNKPLMRKSILLGALLGTIFGGLIGAGFGAIATTLNGILIGLSIGLGLGLLTGVLTAALTVRLGGTTGGVSVGAYTGMAFGGVFGMILGVLIPAELRLRANTEGMPVLDALMLGRFETAMLSSFLLSILATMVGAWVGGKNLAPRALKVDTRDRIDQYDLVEVIQVPEDYTGIIHVGDIGVAVEIYDQDNFEVECVEPDGSGKWLATLDSRHVRLKSKIPDNL